MGEGEIGGEERQKGAVVLCAVFAVPEQGHAAGGELDADLVGAPGFECDEHKGGVAVRRLAGFEDLIGEVGLLHALARVCDHKALVALRVLEQQVEVLAGLGFGAAVHQRKVFLIEVSLGHGAAERRRGLPRFGIDHQPRRRGIEAVDGEIGLAAVLLHQQLGHGGAGRFLLQRLRLALNARGLDANDDVLVRIINAHVASSRFLSILLLF